MDITVITELRVATDGDHVRHAHGVLAAGEFLREFVS